MSKIKRVFERPVHVVSGGGNTVGNFNRVSTNLDIKVGKYAQITKYEPRRIIGFGERII